MPALCAFFLADAAIAQVKRQKFGDWTKECLTVAGKPARCHVAQTLVDKKGRKIVYFIVAKKNGSTYLEVGAPLGILIPAGVSVQFDAQKARSMQLVDCDRSGCRAVLPLPAAQLDELKKGQEISVSFVDSKSGKKLVLKGSLKGFGDAARSF
jgi:invasion protein IalB